MIEQCNTLIRQGFQRIIREWVMKRVVNVKEDKDEKEAKNPAKRG